GYVLERLEAGVTRNLDRVTTVVRLAGAGDEGLGEDVTWYTEEHDREQAAGRHVDARIVLVGPRDRGAAQALGLRERRARPGASAGWALARRRARSPAAARDLRRLARPGRPPFGRALAAPPRALPGTALQAGPRD